MKIVLFFIVLTQFLYASDNYYYKNNKKVTIIPTVSLLRATSTIDYYKNDRGIVLGVSDKLILKLQDGNDIQDYLLEFNLIIEKLLAKNLYLLRVKDKSLTIDISNRLSEKEDVLYAHPDFIKKRISR